MQHPLLITGRPTIHYTQLADLPPDDVLFHEWNTYRRELPRLLQEGHERKFGLFKGDAVVGIFETDEEATAAGYAKFTSGSFMVRPILEYEPQLRVSWLWYNAQCPS